MFEVWRHGGLDILESELLASHRCFLFPYNWDIHKHPQRPQQYISICVRVPSLLAWGNSSSHHSATPYLTTTTKATTIHFREKLVFCAFALICCITSCLRYLISMWFSRPNGKLCWYPPLGHRIGLLLCFLSQKCCLPNNIFSHPLQICVSPASETFISINDQWRALVPRT